MLSSLAPSPQQQLAASHDALVAYARELHHALAELQSKADRQQRAEQMRQLAERARAYAADLRQQQPTMAEVLAKMAVRLESLRQAAGEGRSLKSLALKAGQQYEALARMVRERAESQGVELPELKPRNYSRNVYHMFSGFMSATLYTVFPDRSLMLTIALCYTGALVLMEIARRLDPRINAFMVHRLFGAIARPHEAFQVNAGTWYGLAICAIVYFFSPLACVCAVLALGVGDPAAALVGKRWGKHKLRKGKSLEGLVAFAVCAFAVIAVWLLTIPNPALAGAAASRVLVVSAVAAAVGAVAEVYCAPVEDNFAIPLAVAGAVSLVA